MIKFFTLVEAIFLVAILFARPSSINAVPFNNYLELLGGYVEVTTFNQDSPASVTIDMWVNPSNIKDYSPLISIGRTTHNYEVGINGGSLFLDVRYATNSRKVITAGHIPEGIWSHIHVVVGYIKTELSINDEIVFNTFRTFPLKPVGDTIRLGKSINSATSEMYKGALDEVQIEVDGLQQVQIASVNGVPFILWHLDESRGNIVASDSSGNGFAAALIGGDSKIHFFGVFPTATPRPTMGIRWNRPVLPTLSYPGWFPTPPPQPTTSTPQPKNTQLPAPAGNLHDPNKRPNLPRNF